MKSLFFFAAVWGLSVLPAAAQSFGSAVAVSGEEVIAGEGLHSATPGTVYFYTHAADGTWMQSRTLAASDATEADGFGSALAATDEMLLVGAPIAKVVYVFEKNEEGEWVQTDRVTAEAEGFGGAVAFSRDLMVVGAPGEWQTTGSAYAFRKSESGKWELSGTLLAEDLSERGRYGSVVGISGSRAAVAEPGANNATGVVHTFSFNPETGQWSNDGVLHNPVESENNRFGSALIVVGTHMVVGVPGYDNRTGSAAIFKIDDESAEWEFDERIAPFSTTGSASFGSALAFGAGRLWVGAPGYGDRHGAVFQFVPSTENQRLGTTLLFEAVEIQPTSSFGSTIAVNSQVAFVGASGYDNFEGAAIPFAAVEDGWEQGPPLFTESAVFESVTGGMVECVEGMAGDFPCSDVNLASMLSVKDLGGERGIGLNDIWGWEDPETGREYALVGMTNKTSFVDVTDANHPVTLGTLRMTEGASQSVWRDIKVYKDHAFIVSDGAGEHGMQVFDLRRLRNVVNAPVEFEADARYGKIASAHNIVINEESGFAYIVGAAGGGETCGGGLHMVNIADPQNPTFVGCFADPSTGRGGTGYSHDAQCVIYRGPDLTYQGHEICLGSNETALSIADVTDKESPVAVSMASYPKVDYAHQGWLTDDHQYFYMNDEGDEGSGLVEGTRTLIWDLTDLDQPELAAEYIATTPDTDHNLYVKGNTMYQSNYGAGFRVLDISDRESPVEIGFFDTDPIAGTMGSWSNYPYFKSGVIVVTSCDNGLFVLKKKDVDI